jgi:hypothetical protein
MTALVWTEERKAIVREEFARETGAYGAVGRVAKRLTARFGIEIAKGSLQAMILRDPNLRSVNELISKPKPLPSDPSDPIDPVVEHQERKIHRSYLRDDKALLERLHLAEQRIRLLDEIGIAMPPVKIRERERTSGIHEATAVALASDWHVEELVEPEKVAHRNRYDLSIAQASIRRFFDGVEYLVGYHRQGFTIRELVLWLGGDLITGYIHEELVETNELAPTETILLLRQLLTAGIQQLLRDEKLERIVIPCNYGNHGRTTPERRIQSGAENSFEWLLYHVLAEDFVNEPRVVFQVERSSHVYVDVFRFTVHFHHGDDVNYGGGVGGITIPLTKAIVGWNTVRFAHYHCIGHFHQRLQGRDWSANGSLIGYSPWAFRIKAHYEIPQQSFFLIDSRYGRCMETPIFVEDLREPRVPAKAAI